MNESITVKKIVESLMNTDLEGDIRPLLKDAASMRALMDQYNGKPSADLLYRIVIHPYKKEYPQLRGVTNRIIARKIRGITYWAICSERNTQKIHVFWRGMVRIHHADWLVVNNPFDMNWHIATIDATGTPIFIREHVQSGRLDESALNPHLWKIE